MEDVHGRNVMMSWRSALGIKYIRCYDILDTRMANAMMTPIYIKSVYIITI